MKLYGRGEKRTVSRAFAQEDAPERPKKLITDYFSMNRENTVPQYDERPDRAMPNTENKLCSQQTFLDLGQQDFLFKECKECGMKYDSSFTSEIRLHQRFHKFHTTGMIVKYEKSDVIGRCGEYVSFLVLRQRREEIMELVNNELNAIDLYGDETVYGMADKSGKLVSVIIVDPHPTLLKISRLWTRKDVRRKGLASRLLKDILFFERKNKSDLVFSAPTDAGLSFAKSFIGSDTNVNTYTNR